MSFDDTTAQGAHAGAFIRAVRIRAVVALGFTAAVLMLRPGLSQRVDASEAFPPVERDTPEQVTLSVSADGTTLDLSGPIVFGVKQRVSEVLDSNPAITTLRLASPGGRVVEARKLSEIVGARGLTTVADGNCASACTVVFMAGRDRVITPASTLGFHRYRSPDKEQVEAEENMAIDRRYFSTRGLPDWFIERAFATPNSGMWRPTREEMRLARVITAEVGDDGRRIPVAGEPGPEVPAEREWGRAGGHGVNASETAR